MQSTENRYAPTPGATLGRSRSDQLLLHKRTDWDYLDPPVTRRGAAGASQTLSPRERKAAAHNHPHQHHSQPHPEPHHDDESVQDDVDTIGPPRLSKKEKAYLVRRAKESAQALIEHAHTLDGPVQWHYKGRHRGIQMYRGQGIPMDHGSANANANASALEFLCGVTTMMGTLEEVSEYFDQCTTPRMRMRKADDVVDCAVLYSLVSSNTVNPFHRVAIKYAQYDSPVAMTRKRDFCYLECQDTFRHAGTGRRGWVLSMHSIKLPTCPDVPGFVRASMYHSGFVFIESAERPGYMDVMHSLQINFKGNNHLPHFMLNAALKRRLRELIRISREIQVARIAHRTLLQEKDLMPKNLRSSCVNCSRRFWLLVRKTRCRVCGEVVCQACAPEIDWDTGSAIYPAGAAPSGPSTSTMKTRVCLKCYSSAPTTGSWTARNSTTPWTEQSRMAAAYDHQQAGRHRPFSRPTMQQVDEGAEDSDDDDGGEGRFTFAELEVQSSQSVFAPERFTRSSLASLATTPLQIDQFGADYDDDVYSEQSKNRSRNVGNRGPTSGLHRKDDDTASVQSTEYRWQARATDDSLFDHIGSFSSSIMSRDSYFGRNDDQATFAASRRLTAAAPQLDENEVVMEEPDENQISHVNLRASSRRVRSSSPKTSAPNAGSTKGFEFLDGLIDIPVTRLAGKQQSTAARPRAQTAINVSSSRSAIVHRSLESELNATTLRAHNLRYLNSFERDVPTSSRANYDKPTEQHSAVSEAVSQVGNNASASVGTRESSVPATQPVEEAVSLDYIVPSDSIDYGRVGSISSVATDELLAETSNNSLFSRPSSLILQQVRKNRSRTILFHPSAIDEAAPRDTETFKTVEDEHRRRMDELNQLALEYTGTRISKLDTRPSLAPEPELSEEEEIWRKSSLLEEYQSRRKKTIELLRQRVASVHEDSQARPSNSEFRPSDNNTRVSQANSGRESLFKLTAAESPVPQAPLAASNEQSELDEEPWRSTELMEAYRSKRKNTIEAIRQKMMSIQNEERDSSGTDHTVVSSRSSSFIGTKMVGAPSEHHPNGLPEDLTFIPSLSTSASTLERNSELIQSADIDTKSPSSAMPVEEDEGRGTYSETSGVSPRSHELNDCVSAHSLYEEISHLSRLQREKASTTDSAKQEEIKERIQQQYQLLRTLKLQGGE